MNYLLGLLFLSCVVLLAKLINKDKTLSEYRTSNRELLKKNSSLESKTKSTEVRTGQIAEQFAPYLKDFPYDAKDVRFLGSPIDMIVFDFKGDQVVLIEFKTGESKESPRQRQIREMIKNGRCIYQVIRVKDEVTIKTADPNSGTFSYE